MAGAPTVAELLDRRARGERLTAREWGIIGAERRKAKAGTLAPTGAPPGPPPGATARPGRPPGPPPAAQILAGDPAPDGADSSPTPDPDLVKETTKAVLAGIDQGLQQYTCDLAAKIGADRSAIQDYRKAVAIPPVPAAALVEISPALVAKAGLTAGQYAIGAGFAGLAPWLFMVHRTLTELSELARRAHARGTAPTAPTAPTK